MKKSIVSLLFAALAFCFVSSCDSYDLYYENEEYQVSKNGGPLTIKTISTGIDGVEIDFGNADPWIKVLDFGDVKPGENPDAEVQTKALPFFDGYIKLEVSGNTTGKTRKAVLWATSGGICPPVDIIQGC